MANTKIVKYRDEHNRIRRSMLPIDAPDEEAPLGIPMEFSFPERYEPVHDELTAALNARGITPETIATADDALIRQALQQVLRLDVHELKAMNKEH